MEIWIILLISQASKAAADTTKARRTGAEIARTKGVITAISQSPLTGEGSSATGQVQRRQPGPWGLHGPRPVTQAVVGTIKMSTHSRTGAMCLDQRQHMRGKSETGQETVLREGLTAIST